MKECPTCHLPLIGYYRECPMCGVNLSLKTYEGEWDEDEGIWDELEDED